jgi:hypothetical protein
MSVDHDTFLKWAIGHFGSDNIRVKENGEILANSPYTTEEDRGMNLWMNPSGGKKKLEGGAFRCWKTDKGGTLVWLVADLGRMGYEDAEELLCGITSLRRLEREVDAFFGGTPVAEPYVVEDSVNATIELPPHTYLISDLSKNHEHRVWAEEYLAKRKIPIDGLFVCTRGEYRDRIIIPYYDRLGSLIYYNARTLSKKDDALRYMKPDDETINQNTLLYFLEWPDAGSRVYITEGEFDAMSLNVAGLFGVACGGKFLSEEQVEMLRKFVPVVATDNDEGKRQNSGMEALIAIGNGLLGSGYKEVYYVRPPRGYKDWNAVLQDKGPNVLRAYIQKAEKAFTTSTENHLRTTSL